VIVEDLGESTLLIAELKWLRKMIRPTEHTERQEEFLHAVEQVRKVRAFVKANPRYLFDVREVSKSLDLYANV
jgi:hypothetical protein